MTQLINNDLIWISIPRCASKSIEDSLIKSNLNLTACSDIQKYNNIFPDQDIHGHVKLSVLKEEFGYKNTIRIKRDWFERWLSGFAHVFRTIERHGNYNLKTKWEDVDNEFIYNFFDQEFINQLYIFDDECIKKCFLKFIKEEQIDYKLAPHQTLICVLLSQNYWTENQKCTYEFDFNEIDKFSEFIENRYGEKLNIQLLNKEFTPKNKIDVDQKLRDFVWNSFEKPYIKSKLL